MERRSFVRRAGLAGVLAAGSAPAIVHAQATIRWRLASSFPKSVDTLFGAAESFAKQLHDMSGGKFQVSTHAACELMPAFGVVDGVQNGTVEVAHTAPYYFVGKDPTFALGCAIPFGLNSRQTTSWLFEGNGLKLMREFYANYNMISFPGGNTIAGAIAGALAGVAHASLPQVRPAIGGDIAGGGFAPAIHAGRPHWAVGEGGAGRDTGVALTHQPVRALAIIRAGRHAEAVAADLA